MAALAMCDDRATNSVNLSRLRGRSARSAGWGLSPRRDFPRGLQTIPLRRHPLPNPPRKREREHTVVAAAIEPHQNPVYGNASRPVWIAHITLVSVTTDANVPSSTATEADSIQASF